MIPLFFTRVVFCYGEPIKVPGELSEGEAEKCRLKVEEGLNVAYHAACEGLEEDELWKA